MENQRDIIISKKTSKKNEEEAAVRWADLPQEILGLILGKLLSAVDVIRFRAVCKNWDIAMIKNEDYRNLPWLCNFSWPENQPDLLECNIYDPYSHEISKTWMRSCNNNNNNKGNVSVFGSKQGWLIAAYFDNDIEKWSSFMYNPCTERYKLLFWTKRRPCFATLSSGNPISPGYRYSVFFRDEFQHCVNYIHRYTVDYVNHSHKMYTVTEVLSTRVQIWLLDYEPEECRGMQCMNEGLFCLFDNGVMKRFSFGDESWTSVDLGVGSCELVTDDSDQLWLAKGDGDLLVAVKKDFDGNCWTFCFDWSNMTWVEKDLPDKSAIFISGDIATFVSPFVDYGGRAQNKGCSNVYFFREVVCEKELWM